MHPYKARSRLANSCYNTTAIPAVAIQFCYLHRWYAFLPLLPCVLERISIFGFGIFKSNERTKERTNGRKGRQEECFYRHATQRWVVANNWSDRCDNLVPVAATPQQKLDLDLPIPHYKYYASFNFNLLKVILPPRWCQNPSGKQALWRYPIWPLCCKKIGKVSKQQEAVFFHVYFPACLHGYPHEYLAHTSENTNQRINKK